MTANDNIHRRVADFYASEVPLRAPGRVLDAALEAVERTPQRRSLPGPAWRLPRLNLYARLAVVAVAAIAVGGLAVAIARPGAGPGAAIFPPSPTLRSSPRPTVAPSVVQVLDLIGSNSPLEAGTYRLAPGFPVPITFEVPAGYDGCSAGPVEQSICRHGGTTSPGFGFSIIENVVADPCGTALLNPPVGPSVDDLVTAISGLSGFQATVPVDVSVAGYSGKQFEVTAPPSSVCDLKTWATADRINGVGAGEVNLVQILDVDGVRVMIAGAFWPGQDPLDGRSQIEAMLASVSIGR